MTSASRAGLERTFSGVPLRRRISSPKASSPSWWIGGRGYVRWEPAGLTRRGAPVGIRATGADGPSRRTRGHRSCARREQTADRGAVRSLRRPDPRGRTCRRGRLFETGLPTCKLHRAELDVGRQRVAPVAINRGAAPRVGETEQAEPGGRLRSPKRHPRIGVRNCRLRPLVGAAGASSAPDGDGDVVACDQIRAQVFDGTGHLEVFDGLDDLIEENPQAELRHDVADAVVNPAPKVRCWLGWRPMSKR